MKKWNENYSYCVLWISMSLVLLLISGNASGADAAASPADVMDMSIEQLMQIEVPSTATLTDTKPRLVPATITTITEEQIQAASARSLFELLDIYVPNLIWQRNGWEADGLGLRGIINDRDDKYLILVNGRVMNERTRYGAMSERDLPFMKDIHHIDVVRGPGSGLYGPGAVAMVINIVTHNANTFQGTEVTTRGGVVEQFSTVEIKHGRKFDNTSGIFGYFGIGQYNGADKYDAPQVYGYDFPDQSYFSWWNTDWGTMPGPSHLPQDAIEAGRPATSMSVVNDGRSYRDLPPIKAYTELTLDDWTFWTRYTRGGKYSVPPTGAISRVPWGWYDYNFYFGKGPSGSDMATVLSPNGYGYQQLTAYLGRKMELDAHTTLETSFSYDTFNCEQSAMNSLTSCYREDLYYGKVLLNHELTDRQKVAVGAETLHGEYGLPNINGDQTSTPTQGWSTNLNSLLFEHQWTIFDQLTSFVGARVDYHTYTRQMFSPRAALVFTPSKEDTFKLMWARSVRSNYEDTMRANYETMKAGGDQDSDPEKLDSLELRYERKVNQNLDLAVDPFLHYSLQRITWSSADGAPAVVGKQKEWGIELEAAYHTDTTRFSISHSYTKLLEMEVSDITKFNDNLISSQPYGYGNDLARWSNHITKFQAQYKLNSAWTLDSSMRIYWGFPGSREYDKYVANVLSQYPTMEPGWDKAYKGSYFLNLGVQYQPSKNLTFRLDGYNLLGIFDLDLNKRNYGGPEYRNQAAAAAVSMTYKF